MDRFIEDSITLELKSVLGIIQNRILNNTRYFGVKALKNPLDYWIYQEIIFAHKPDVIVEIGNNYGGSTLALAHMQDLMDRGRVIAVDINHSKISTKVKNHTRILWIEQDAISAFNQVRSMIEDGERVLVIEDSSHTYDNTLEVLKRYSQLIHVGDYMIVEDSICHHGLEVGPNPGQYEAIESFMKNNDEFIIDRTREDFLITWNPKVFLKRVK
jgi:cephalosporin hydroxylase